MLKPPKHRATQPAKLSPYLPRVYEAICKNLNKYSLPDNVFLLVWLSPVALCCTVCCFAFITLSLISTSAAALKSHQAVSGLQLCASGRMRSILSILYAALSLARTAGPHQTITSSVFLHRAWSKFVMSILDIKQHLGGIQLQRLTTPEDRTQAQGNFVKPFFTAVSQNARLAANNGVQRFELRLVAWFIKSFWRLLLQLINQDKLQDRQSDIYSQFTL